MKIAPRQVTVRELVSEYRDDGEGGVLGHDGKLDILPPFRREFVYTIHNVMFSLHCAQPGPSGPARADRRSSAGRVHPLVSRDGGGHFMCVLTNRRTTVVRRDFSALMRFRIGDFIFAKGAHSVLGNRFQRLTIHFSHVGLLAGWGQYQQVGVGDDGKWWIEHYGHALFIEGPPGRSLNGMEDNPLITVAGREIAALCQHEPHPTYLSHFAEFLKNQDCELKLARILARVDKGFRISTKRVVEPLVEAEERGDEKSGDA